MAKEHKPAMLFYGREFFDDLNVMAMNYEEIGVYLQLLWLCWQEGALPNDTKKLAAICRGMAIDKFEADIWPSMRELFIIEGDRLIHPKVEKVRIATTQLHEARSQAGKDGAEIRWRGRPVAAPSQADSNDLDKLMAEPLAKPWQADGKLMPSEFRIPNSEYPIVKIQKNRYVHLAMHVHLKMNQNLLKNFGKFIHVKKIKNEV